MLTPALKGQLCKPCLTWTIQRSLGALHKHILTAQGESLDIWKPKLSVLKTQVGFEPDQPVGRDAMSPPSMSRSGAGNMNWFRFQHSNISKGEGSSWNFGRGCTCGKLERLKLISQWTGANFWTYSPGYIQVLKMAPVLCGACQLEPWKFRLQMSHTTCENLNHLFSLSNYPKP